MVQYVHHFSAIALPLRNELLSNILKNNPHRLNSGITFNSIQIYDKYNYYSLISCNTTNVFFGCVSKC